MKNKEAMEGLEGKMFSVKDYIRKIELYAHGFMEF
jgi:hypothetical protein